MIFPSTIRGGVEEYTLKIALAAVKKGWNVHVAFPRAEGTVSLVQEFTSKGIQYHPLNIAEVGERKFEKPFKHLMRFIRTVAILFKIRPDVVQVNLPSPKLCFGSIIACGLLKSPAVIVFHLVSNSFLFSSIKKRLLAWARCRNQQWVSVSKNNQELICNSLSICTGEVMCIYNGVDVKSSLEALCPRDFDLFRHQLIEELSLPNNSQLLLTVGRLSHQKGYNILIPVIPYIANEFPDVIFLWAGEGEQRDLLTSKVNEYNIKDKVVFLGFRSDIPRFLKAADLFIFPTLYEGQPFAILEAMSSGLPIVTSSASGIPEVIENKMHGLTFRTGDSCDLLETVRWALKHPQDMQEMAQNAQLRVQEFTEERMINETFKLWQKVCSTA